MFGFISKFEAAILAKFDALEAKVDALLFGAKTKTPVVTLSVGKVPVVVPVVEAEVKPVVEAPPAA